METKIIYKKPMLYFLIKLLFRDYNFNNGVIFSFGNKIYTNKELKIWKRGHEFIHCKQMKFSSIYAIIYFIKYLFLRKFRLKSELEAFQTEYLLLGKTEYALHELSLNLSGPLYGNLCSYHEARDLISQ